MPFWMRDLVIVSSKLDGIHLDPTELPQAGQGDRGSGQGDPGVIGHALVRPPGASFAHAISSSQAVIDVALAQAQHAEYRQALAEAGVTVEILPPDERYPDSCFMQDPAMVIAGRAIINRPGAASRRGEEEALVELLAARFPTTRIVAPGTLEGGDVLILPDRVVVGRSDRTNRAGIAQLVVALADLTEPALTQVCRTCQVFPVFPCSKRPWRATCTCSAR